MIILSVYIILLVKIQKIMEINLQNNKKENTAHQYKRKFLIDLDGVLNEYNGDYKKDYIPPIKEGAKEFLEKLKREFMDCELYLFTTRSLLLSAKWLIENELDDYFLDVTNIKNSAYLIIDDRTVCFKGDFGKVFDEIKRFRVYWKNG